MANHRVVLALVATLATGCFGYNRSARRWSYVGDAVLIAGGAAAITADQLGSSPPPAGPGRYDPPFSGVTLAGAVLVVAGVVGIVFNATRTEVKTSR